MAIKNHKKSWYKVNAVGDGKSEILIYGHIGASYWDDESVTAKSLIAELNDLGDDDVIVRINSIGGSVADGIAIFNALRRHSGEVTTSIEGVAYSAGSLIAMAGEEVEMAENAMLMIHAPASYASGNAKEMRRQADMLDKYSDAMTLSYVRDGGPAKEDIEAWLKDGEDHYFTSSEAKENGMVDSITGAIDATACAMGMDFTGYRPIKSQQLIEPKEVPDMAKKVVTDPADPAPTTNKAGSVPDNPNPAPVAVDPAHEEVDVSAQLAARNIEIKSVLDPHSDIEGVSDLLISALSDPKMTVGDVRQSALDLLGKNITSVSGGRVHIVEDERDKNIAAVSDALLARGNVKDEAGKIISVRGNPYRGMTLMELARSSLSKVGVDTTGQSKLEVVGVSFTNSSSDFPIILENVMHKTLQGSYRIAPDTWSRVCSVGSVSDFRAHNRYQLGGIGNLSPINELGEFENKDISDGGKETVTISTKGNLVGISRHAIINDDLDAFVGLANNLGRATKRTIEADFYKSLASNSGAGPLLSDGNGIFTAGHGNVVATTGPPSVTLIEKGILLMSAQLANPAEDAPATTEDYDYLDISPKIWLGHKSMEMITAVLNSSTYDPAMGGNTSKNQNTPNPYNGLFDDIVGSARVAKAPTNYPWYIFADPLIDPVIEVSFLDGEQEPFLEMQDGWSVDGVQWKIRLDYGVSGIGKAGAVKFPGGA